MSYRISTRFQDNSQTVQVTTGAIAATVIKASKGPATPIFLDRGSTQKILEVFGYPSVTYPGVQDVLDLNGKSGLWVSAPAGVGAKYGGVFVTKTGTIPFINGFTTKTISSWSTIPASIALGTGNGVQTVFSGTFINPSFYKINTVDLEVDGVSATLSASTSRTEVIKAATGSEDTFTKTIFEVGAYTNQSIDILVDGVSINVTASNAEPEILTTSPDVGDGTFTRATGALSFTFDTDPTIGQIISVQYDVNTTTVLREEVISTPDVGTGSLVKSTGAFSFTFDTAPTLGKVITSSYDIDLSTQAYFALFCNDQRTDDMQVKLIEGTTAGSFDLSLYMKGLDSTFYEIAGSPVTVSPTSGAKDGFGRNIYLNEVFKDSIYLTPVINTALAFSTFVDDTVAVSLAGGTRGATVIGSAIAAIYPVFQDLNKYPVNLFFDTTGEATVATALDALRTYCEADKVYPRVLLPTIDQTAATSITTPLVAKNNIANRGVYYYTLTWGEHRDIYLGQNFVCSNMGLIAGKHVDCINLKYGGGAPAWIDENSIGGQLGGSIVKLNHSASQTQLRQLDEVGINAVVIDPVYGPMIVSQKTTQSSLSDYSYIAHSGLADYLVGIISKQVLVGQLMKANDMIHRTQVKTNTEIVLRTVGNQLRDYFVKCDEENNNDDVLAQRKFILTVAVKFTPYSEFIEFTFINTAQGTDVREAVNKTI